MRFTVAKVSGFLSLLGVVLASGLEPRERIEPKSPNAFICGNKDVFTVKFLKNLADNLKSRHQFLNLKRFSKIYDGPPFTKPYLAWPISLETDSYDKALLGPYRAIIKGNSEIFSVVSKGTYGIQECKMLSPVTKKYENHPMICGNTLFSTRKLSAAAATACQDILKIAAHEFPARYDGPHFSEFGEQRYIYPIKAQSFVHDTEPGPFRVVINSACDVVGAITIYKHGEIFPCAMV